MLKNSSSNHTLKDLCHRYEQWSQDNYKKMTKSLYLMMATYTMAAVAAFISTHTGHDVVHSTWFAWTCLLILCSMVPAFNVHIAEHNAHARFSEQMDNEQMQKEFFISWKQAQGMLSPAENEVIYHLLQDWKQGRAVQMEQVHRILKIFDARNRHAKDIQEKMTTMDKVYDAPIAKAKYHQWL